MTLVHGVWELTRPQGRRSTGWRLTVLRRTRICEIVQAARHQRAGAPPMEPAVGGRRARGPRRPPSATRREQQRIDGRVRVAGGGD